MMPALLLMLFPHIRPRKKLLNKTMFYSAKEDNLKRRESSLIQILFLATAIVDDFFPQVKLSRLCSSDRKL